MEGKEEENQLATIEVSLLRKATKVNNSTVLLWSEENGIKAPAKASILEHTTAIPDLHEMENELNRAFTLF